MVPGMADDGKSGGTDDAGSGAEDDGRADTGSERESDRTGESEAEDPVDFVLELVEIRPAEVRCGISLVESGDSNGPDHPDNSNGSGGPDEE